MATHEEIVKAGQLIAQGIEDGIRNTPIEQNFVLMLKGETMSKLEKAKEIIKENYKEALCGIYDTMNTAGDEMHYLYDDGELKIFICYGWEYFEVFGLDSKEFSELRKYYHALRRGKAE